MFYLQFSNHFISDYLKKRYLETVNTLPFSTSTLVLSNIYVYDNIEKCFINHEPISDQHSAGYDGHKIVFFDKASSCFNTSYQFVYCSAATEVFIDSDIRNNILNSGYSKEDLTIPEIESVQGVPGCGKSTWILNTHNIGSDLVLCATKEGTKLILDKVENYCLSENLNFDSIKFNYRTIASYLKNGSRRYDTVFIDEYLMVHAGFIGLVSILSKCKKLVLLGDKNQIPFIDRYHFVDMKYFNPTFFLTSTKTLNCTHRCPADIVHALCNIYPNFKTLNSRQKSVSVRNFSSLSDIPLKEETLYLTFLKKDKLFLIDNLSLSHNSKILTIHEAQGSTFKNVVCFRRFPNELTLYNSQPHVVVALTRHSETFEYVRPAENSDDLLSSFVRKAFFANLSELSNVMIPRTETIESNENCLNVISKLNSNKNPPAISKYRNLNFYFHNVNRMSSKASAFNNFVLKSEFDVYLLCETALNPKISSSEFFPSNYVVYRCDRTPLTSAKLSGGGVLIALKSNISSETIDFPPMPIEMVGIKIRLRNLSLFLFVIYIPPSSNNDLYTKCCELIYEACLNADSNDLILITGDFNLPHIKWFKEFSNDQFLLPSNISNENEAIFIDAIHAISLFQINNIANFRGVFLDLVFVNNTDIFSVSECSRPFVSNDLHHKATEIVFNIKDFQKDVKCPRNTEPQYNLRKIDVVGFGNYLGDINWVNELSESDINVNVNKLYDLIFLGFEKFAPIFKPSPCNYPPWYDSTLINLKNIKNRAYSNMLKNKNTNNYSFHLNNFNSSYDDFVSYYNQRHKDYITEIQNRIKTNPKQFWNYFRTKCEFKELPSSMQLNDIHSSNKQEICNMFASFFQSVYKPEDINHFREPYPCRVGETFIDLPVIEMEDIMSTLKSFNDGCGPDKIPSYILKQFGGEIALPLSIIFNKSLTTGQFPNLWKTNRITPIFKSGSRNDISCFRAISNSSSIPKLFEATVCSLIKDRLSNLISIKQHGFLPGKSTSTNLVEFTNIAINAIEQGQQIDTIHTDFSKAFDSCSHAKTLTALYNIGFSIPFCLWIKSYLTSRSQYVEIDGIISNKIDATSGVPQGSHLGPWLFLCLINSVEKKIDNSLVLLFADDMKMFRIIEKIEDAILLQKDINNLLEWCDEVGLELNISKCKVMSLHRKSNPISYDYHINNTNLTCVSEIKDLGITFTENVTFNKHIDNIITKANQMSGFIKRWTKDFSNPDCLITLYYALVRSQLEYAVPVWNPYYDIHIKRLETVQKRFLTFLYFKSSGQYDSTIPFHENILKLPPYTLRCKDLNILTLQDRRKYLSISFLFNILQNHTFSPFILENINFQAPVRNLRNNSLLNIKFHRTNYGNNEPITSMSKFFNETEHLFDFNISKINFQKLLKNFFMNNY